MQSTLDNRSSAGASRVCRDKVCVDRLRARNESELNLELTAEDILKDVHMLNLVFLKIPHHHYAAAEPWPKGHDHDLGAYCISAFQGRFQLGVLGEFDWPSCGLEMYHY